jgi:hypothetical protein
MDKLFSDINNLYNKKGFLERYGSDIWLTIIILITFFLIASYFYIMNHIKPIISDWNNKKCSPVVLPFAGLINKPANMSAFEFTASNFTDCINSILANISEDAFAPIHYLMHVFTQEFKLMSESVNSIRALFHKIRVSLQTVMEDVMSRLLNIVMPIIQFIIISKDMLGKIIGTLNGTLYTVFGAYLTLKSLFLNIINFIIIILIALSASIAALLILALIPIIGVPAEIAVVPMIATMTAILIPTIIIQTLMKDVFKLPTRAPPSIPGCFSKNTILIKTGEEGVKQKNKLEITIDNIKIGDYINDNETMVTGVIKFSAEEQRIYTLYNTIVTGEHRVYHNTLGWIKVKDHPNSRMVLKFNEPFVYCLLTTTKEFKIGNVIYSDWDDIDKNVMKKIIRNCPYIPRNFKKNHIHSYLDNGVHEDSNIKLSNGIIKYIKNIDVNDILNNGEKVVGIVKIDAKKLKGGIHTYVIPLNNKLSPLLENTNNSILNISTIIGSNNIQIIDTRFKNVNTFELVGQNDTISDSPIKNVDFLYQLLTTSGEFDVNGIRIKDYNYGIDKYLSW